MRVILQVIKYKKWFWDEKCILTSLMVLNFKNSGHLRFLGQKARRPPKNYIDVYYWCTEVIIIITIVYILFSSKERMHIMMLMTTLYHLICWR